MRGNFDMYDSKILVYELLDVIGTNSFLPDRPLDRRFGDREPILEDNPAVMDHTL